MSTLPSTNFLRTGEDIMSSLECVGAFNATATPKLSLDFQSAAQQTEHDMLALIRNLSYEA